MPKKMYVLRDIPEEVFSQFTARADRDGWPSKTGLVVQLMCEFGAGTITPTAAPPPPDPKR